VGNKSESCFAPRQLKQEMAQPREASGVRRIPALSFLKVSVTSVKRFPMKMALLHLNRRLKEKTESTFWVEEFS
jgi:hypothetical protein